MKQHLSEWFLQIVIFLPIILGVLLAMLFPICPGL